MVQMQGAREKPRAEAYFQYAVASGFARNEADGPFSTGSQEYVR